MKIARIPLHSMALELKRRRLEIAHDRRHGLEPRKSGSSCFARATPRTVHGAYCPERLA